MGRKWLHLGLVLAAVVLCFESAMATKEETSPLMSNMQANTHAAQQQAEHAEVQARQGNNNNNQRPHRNTEDSQGQDGDTDDQDDEQEEQRELNCVELAPQIKQIFEAVSSSVNVPPQVLLAGRGLAVSSARGQEEINRKIQNLARTQDRTNHCVAHEYAPLSKARDLVKSVSQSSGISANDLLKRMAEIRSRMKLYRDLKKEGTLSSTILEEFREMLDVSGEMPYQRFKRTMEDHQGETKGRLSTLKRTVDHHSRSLKSIGKSSHTQRLILDRVEQRVVATRSMVNDAMSSEKEIGDEQARMNEALKKAESSVKSWNQRLTNVEGKEAHDFHTATKALHEALATLERGQSEDFKKMSNWTLAEKEILMQSNKALKDEVSKPLKAARKEIEKFRYSKNVMQKNMNHDIKHMANTFNEESSQLQETIGNIVSEYLKQTEAEVNMKVNKDLAAARHHLLMMAQRQMGSQEIELGNMRDEIASLRKEAWDLKRKSQYMERMESNQEDEWNRYRQNMMSEWDRGNSGLKDRERKLRQGLKQESQKLLSTQQTFKQRLSLQQKGLNKEFKRKVKSIERNLDTEAGSMRENTEFKLNEITGELAKDKEEIDGLRSQLNKALMVNSRMVDSYDDSSSQVKQEVDDLNTEISTIAKKVPSAAEMRKNREDENNKAKDECHYVAKAVADSIAPKEAARAAQAALATHAVVGLKADACAKKNSEDKLQGKKMLELTEPSDPKF